MRKPELQTRLENAHEELRELAKALAAAEAKVAAGGVLIAELRNQLAARDRMIAETRAAGEAMVAVERTRAEQLLEKLHAYAGIGEDVLTGRATHRTEEDEISAARERGLQEAAAAAAAELEARGMPAVL